MNALEIMQERFSELERLARAAGLDPYDVVFFNVPVGVIYEVASYGLPTRYSHWSFGKVYQYQKTQGEMGMSKIFELILNNNPSYAFLDKNNPNTVNLLVAAHCYAPGTCVQTTEGLKVIEDIRKGDQVYAYDGSIGKVSAPTCNIYDGEMVTIQAGSNSFTQTEDHNLYAILTQSHERRKYRSWAKAFEEVDYQPQWVEAANLKPGDFLVVNKPRRHFSITSLPTIVIEISKTHWRRKIEKSINITLDAEFGELIGLYLAEGYACPKGQMGLCFHANETELHNRSEELIKTFFGLDAKTKIRHDTSSAVVEFNEICIAAYLREMLGHSCYFKHVPTEWMENAPLDFLKGILKGFLLGDGTKCHDRDMGYTTTSALLAMQIQQIAMQCGIYFGVSSRDQSTEDQPRHISYAGLCCGIYDNKVRKLLGIEERKTSRTWSGVIEKDDKFYVKINSVSSEEYSGIVHCMQVEDKYSFTLANGIVTHNCYGHSDFFKNNVMFRECGETKMIEHAKRHADMIDQYRKDFGDDEVDMWLDIALALEHHVDVYKGLKRGRYPKRHVEYEEREMTEWEDIVDRERDPLIEKVLKGIYLPPYPEKDLLWFLTEYASLESWQQQIFEIVRRESYYFYPQFRCVVAGSLLHMPGKGLVPIEDVCPANVKSVPSALSLLSKNNEMVLTSHLHTMNATETVKVKTSPGFSIEGTPEHPIEVMDTDGHIKLKKIGELSGDEWVVVCGGGGAYGTKDNLDEALSLFESKIESNHRHHRIVRFGSTNFHSQRQWELLARIAGHVCAEGNLSNNTVTFSNSDEVVLDDYRLGFEELFDIDPSKSDHKNGVITYSTRSELLIEMLSFLGFDVLGKSNTKQIPWFVLQGTQAMQNQFLSAYFESDGMNNGEKISATSKSEKLISQIQIVLLNMGIYSTNIVDKAGFARLDIRGSDAVAFIQNVGFISERKQNKQIKTDGRIREKDYIPFLLKEMNGLRAERVRGTYYENSNGVNVRLSFSPDKGLRYKELPRHILKMVPQFIRSCKELDFKFGLKVEAALASTGYFVPISSIERIEKPSRVYDVTVPSGHLFLCNGIINHNTKIMNEGWASYWHAELMRQYSYGNANDYGITDIQHPLTSEEHLDFAAAHEKVVQAGIKIPLKVEVVNPETGKKEKRWNPLITANPHNFRIATRLNPYYVGFRMFRDIKDRWDEYYEVGYREDEWDTKIPVHINGDQKIREVMTEEDDISFLRNYLTEELAEELGLFSYGNNEKFNDNYDIQEGLDQPEEKDVEGYLDDYLAQVIENKTIICRSKEVKDVVDSLAKGMNNYGVPEIVVRRVDETGLLRLEHVVNDATNIDIGYAKYVLKYIWKAWGGRVVEMVRKAKDRTWTMTYDGIQFDIDHQTTDYPETIEKEAPPSSW